MLSRSSVDVYKRQRIPILQQDVFITLLAKNFLYFEGRLNKNAGVSGQLNVKLVNNALAFLFEEIRYEVAGVEVGRTKNVGITTTVKNLLSIKQGHVNALKNAGWVPNGELKVTDEGYFNVCLPLKLLLGLSEDYFRIC